MATLTSTIFHLIIAKTDAHTRPNTRTLPHTHTLTPTETHSLATTTTQMYHPLGTVILLLFTVRTSLALTWLGSSPTVTEVFQFPVRLSTLLCVNCLANPPTAPYLHTSLTHAPN